MPAQIIGIDGEPARQDVTHHIGVTAAVFAEAMDNDQHGARVFIGQPALMEKIVFLRPLEMTFIMSHEIIGEYQVLGGGGGGFCGAVAINCVSKSLRDLAGNSVMEASPSIMRCV